MPANRKSIWTLPNLTSNCSRCVLWSPIDLILPVIFYHFLSAKDTESDSWHVGVLFVCASIISWFLVADGPYKAFFAQSGNHRDVYSTWCDGQVRIRLAMIEIWDGHPPDEDIAWKTHYKVDPRGHEIAKLANISPTIMVYGTSNYSFWGLQTNLILRGPTL